MNRLLCPSLMIGALLFAAPVCAQENAANKAAAEALYQQGQQLMSDAKYEAACDKFRSSQQLDAGLGTLLHLADCYQKLGRTASAWATFEEASSIAASRGETSRYEIARARATALKPALSYIVIRANDALPAGVTVERDGSPLPAALWGVPVPNDPGEVIITVAAEGYTKAEVKVVVGKATPTPIEIALPVLQPSEPSEAVEASTNLSSDTTAPSEQPAGETASDDNGPSLRTWGIVASGVGAVALGVSLVLTIMGNSDHEESLDDCSDQNENNCGPTGVKLRNDAISKLGIATGFGIGGAVVLGGGVLLYVAAPSGDSASPAAMGVGYRGVW